MLARAILILVALASPAFGQTSANVTLKAGALQCGAVRRDTLSIQNYCYAPGGPPLVVTHNCIDTVHPPGLISVYPYDAASSIAWQFTATPAGDIAWQAANQPPGVGGPTYTSVFGSAPEFPVSELCVAPLIPFTAFQAPSFSMQVPIASVPAGWSPREIQVETTKPFSSPDPRVTAIFASVGTLQDPAYYLPALSVMATGAAAADNAASQPATTGPQTILVRVYVGNVNPGDLAALVAGELRVKLCGVVSAASSALKTGTFNAIFGQPPKQPVKVGTLVNGKCGAPTGFHVVSPGPPVFENGILTNPARVEANEVQGNCILP